MPEFDKKSFAGGLFGGMVGIGISHPFDTVRVVFQENNYKSITDCTKNLYKTGGLARFYKGIKPPLFGIGLEKCIVFGTYSNVKNANLFGNFYTQP